jgi:hypothetical protein
MTSSTRIRRRSSKNAKELTDLEHSILLAVKRRPVATVQEIRRELNWPADSVAIRLALLRLEERKFIVHSIELGQFYYRHAGPSGRQTGPTGDSAGFSQPGR